jgi:transposase
MRGPKPKYKIQLQDDQISTLQHLIHAHNAPQVQVLRARIVLSAHTHADWSNQQISQETGCTDRMVRKWRRRWAETQCLEDLPRSGAPKRFSP